MATELQGFLLIHKPKDITSFDCIRHIKKIFRGSKLKIGHAGTLDPFASGLLIIALSRQATKHISLVMKLSKQYTATGKLGELTNTLDKTGTITQTDVNTVSQAQIQDILPLFTPEYMQTPPTFAALKYQGKPLYILARNKKIADSKLAEITEHKQRTVQIHALELLSFEQPFFTIQTHVSHGTYIRSLVNDIALRVGTFATTYNLERTAIGPFNLAHAQNLDTFSTKEDVEKYLITIADFIEHIKEYKNL